MYLDSSLAHDCYLLSLVPSLIILGLYFPSAIYATVQASNAEFLCEHNFDFNKVPVGTDLASFPGSHHAWSLGMRVGQILMLVGQAT